MGLLSFLFGSKKDVPVQEEVSSKILPEIKEEDFVDNSDPNEDLYTVHYGTKMPIDAIYAYINRDYERRRPVPPDNHRSLPPETHRFCFRMAPSG